MTGGMGTSFDFHISTLLRRERRFVAGLVAPTVAVQNTSTFEGTAVLF
jgi:hypothetical protein